MSAAMCWLLAKTLCMSWPLCSTEEEGQFASTCKALRQPPVLQGKKEKRCLNSHLGGSFLFPLPLLVSFLSSFVFFLVAQLAMNHLPASAS